MCDKRRIRQAKPKDGSCCLQVLLVSAQDALLARLVLSGKADQEQKWRFARVAFGSRSR